MAEEVYGFDYDRAVRLKAVADHPRVVNQLNLQRRRPTGGVQAKTVYPPPGGIPAATWNATTKELLPARAACKVAEYNTATGKLQPSANLTEIVENQVTSVVGASGKPMTVITNQITGYWEVIVEDCSGTTSTSTSVSSSFSTAAVSVDPISQGSASLGMGYEGI